MQQEKVAFAYGVCLLCKYISREQTANIITILQ